VSSQKTASNEIEVLGKTEELPKLLKRPAEYADDFAPPIYNVWTFGKKTNEVDHFGNSEQRIVDNPLAPAEKPGSNFPGGDLLCRF